MSWFHPAQLSPGVSGTTAGARDIPTHWCPNLSCSRGWASPPPLWSLQGNLPAAFPAAGSWLPKWWCAAAFLWDVPLTLIQPHKPPLSCHYPEPPSLVLSGGFYPIFSSAEPGAGREASQGAGGSASRRSMQTTFPTLHAFAAGATWLLAAIGSFFVFIA